MSKRSKSLHPHQQNTMLKSIVFYFALQNRFAKPNGCCFLLCSRIALEGAILRLRSAPIKIILKHFVAQILFEFCLTIF